METAQQRHKRYQRDEGVIVNYANAFGVIAAGEKYDVRSILTIQKMMQRRGNGIRPTIDKRAMHDSGESYYSGVVQQILSTILDLKAQLAEEKRQNLELRQTIDRFKEDSLSFFAVSRQREETVMQELLNQIHVPDKSL